MSSPYSGLPKKPTQAEIIAFTTRIQQTANPGVISASTADRKPRETTLILRDGVNANMIADRLRAAGYANKGGKIRVLSNVRRIIVTWPR